MSSNPERSNITGKLGAEEDRTLTIPASGTIEISSGIETIVYHPLPSSYSTIEDAPVWRILLKFSTAGHRVMAGLDIHADIVIGRGSGDAESPDIDLTELGALEHGVSRIHALLRPTFNKLYIVDLNSTNGTFVNGVQTKRGRAQAIHHRDALAFAGLACAVEIISLPSAPIELPPPDTHPADIDLTLKHGKPKTGTETIFGVKLDLPITPDDPDSQQ